jgi:hypothetical protein
MHCRMMTATQTGNEVRLGYTPTDVESVVPSSVAIKQATLSLATGVAVHGRDHVSVVLLFTVELTLMGRNNGTGEVDMKGVANLIVSTESGFTSLKAIDSWFETPQ